ncbi:hypothetical protein BC834DRAFT_1045088 [Gloeopeniophorella convolvens]|nr:hypothetical protein BC834DRAFT_1045088 [Gloeopeniophorella convolvens]
MWRRNYQALPQDKSEEDFTNSESSLDSVPPVVLSNRTKALLRYGFFIIAVCTVFDALLLLVLGYRYAKATWYPLDPDKLETPSTYINFDLSTATARRQTRNLPAMARVFLAPYGTVPYNDRHLLVEPGISTFLQFRALDYGLEECKLTLEVPEYGAKNMHIARVGTPIDVWSLEVDGKVDLLKLSYNTLPRRVEKVGTFTPRYNSTESLPSFACTSGTYHAFLLTCSEGARKEDCWMDVTSVGEDNIGLYLEQHQTI